MVNMVNGKASDGFSGVYCKLLLNLCFSDPSYCAIKKKKIKNFRNTVIASAPVLNLPLPPPPPAFLPLRFFRGSILAGQTEAHHPGAAGTQDHPAPSTPRVM